jgi:hypothetical protein
VPLILGVFCCVAASLGAAETAPRAAYSWKKDDLFRFRYTKTIGITQPDENGVVAERVTEVDAVLILEIKSVTEAGAAGLLRFDSPRITLPPIEYFSSQSDAPEKPENQMEKTRSLAHAMDGAVKQARWSFTWATDGALRLEARVPANLHEWLREVGAAGNWRKKLGDQLSKLIEQDLGLRTPGTDYELFLCLSAPPAADISTCTLHPLRSAPTLVSNSRGKAELSFQRVAPSAAAPFAVPGLIAARKVLAAVQSVTTKEGRAVFDTKLRMLDSLSENYVAEVLYTYGKETLKQQVRVQYKLERLAPAIAAPE